MPRATARVASTVGIIIGQYKSLCVTEWLKYIKENNLDNPGKFWLMVLNTEIRKKPFNFFIKYLQILRYN
ncbi:MAG: hypothetical protein WC860_08110 [Candidatus Margulisiibacteriota bacterium]|jgi:hypothetical protein